MLKGKERRIVLDCLYQEIYEREMRNSGFAVRSAMIAESESQLKYENISHSQRIDIYYNFISKKITNYIHDDLKNPTQCIGSTEVPTNAKCESKNMQDIHTLECPSIKK